jgi:hypothetical protein
VQQKQINHRAWKTEHGVDNLSNLPSSTPNSLLDAALFMDRSSVVLSMQLEPERNRSEPLILFLPHLMNIVHGKGKWTLLRGSRPTHADWLNLDTTHRISILNLLWLWTWRDKWRVLDKHTAFIVLVYLRIWQKYLVDPGGLFSPTMSDPYTLVRKGKIKQCFYGKVRKSIPRHLSIRYFWMKQLVRFQGSWKFDKGLSSQHGCQKAAPVTAASWHKHDLMITCRSLSFADWRRRGGVLINGYRAGVPSPGLVTRSIRKQ